MFIRWDNKQAVRLTGRWSRVTQDRQDTHSFIQHTSSCTTATAAGSYFELAFTGREALLHFDLGYCGQPSPHLWISLDGGARVEVPVDRYLRVQAQGAGQHIVTVIYKGGMEMLPRWHEPLMGAVSFKGAEAEGAGVLPKDDRRIIEFIGDSITEGVLIDTDNCLAPDDFVRDQFFRPYQDDNCATYARLLAEMLDLRPVFQAYGAAGLTRSGCGSVPRAGLIYPYCFDGMPYTGEKPDIVVINHGTNDQFNSAEEYIMRYGEFVDIVRKNTPDAVIICLSPFCGVFDGEIADFVRAYNADHKKPIHFVSGANIVPPEPVHPTRENHRKLAETFLPRFKDILGMA